jgi:hypothetical protein
VPAQATHREGQVRTEVLVEVRRGLALAHAVPVRHVDELVLMGEPGVGGVKARELLHARQVLQVVVTPAAQEWWMVLSEGVI